MKEKKEKTIYLSKKYCSTLDFLHCQELESLRNLDPHRHYHGRNIKHDIVRFIMDGIYENNKKCSYVRALEIIWNVYSDRKGEHNAHQELLKDIGNLEEERIILNTRLSWVMEKPYKYYPHNLLYRAVRREILRRFKDEPTITKSLNNLNRYYGYYLNEYDSRFRCRGYHYGL